MSKSKRAILITLAVLLVLLTAALLFVYHTIDSASTPYSEKIFRSFLLETIQSDNTSATVWFRGIEPAALRESADGVVENLFETSGLAQTCVHSIDTHYVSVLGHIYTSISVHYYSGFVPSEMPFAATEAEAVDLFLDAFDDGETLLYIATDNERWNEETMQGIASSVFGNLSTSAEVSAYYLDIYPETGDDRALYLEIEYGVSEADRLAKTVEMNAALDEWADEIRALDLVGEEALYRAAHDLILDRVEYDFDLADASDSYDDMSNQDKFNRSAYGAAVTGKTVCSGYAYAYKELCDRLALPCWVANGSCGGPHAWNLVLLDGAVYIVDCTNDDEEGADNAYFLLPQRSWGLYGYELDPGFVIPW